jgi:ligand-binding SRPBCC domain-containing protein
VEPLKTKPAVTIDRQSTLYRLSCTQRVVEPIERVFPFFSEARNLERLTPAFLRFQILASSHEVLQAGSLIDYRLRLHGVPVRWRTRIEEWAPPLRFVDVQIRGPFRYWQHLHEFVQDEGGTLVKDTVDFDVYCQRLYQTPLLGWIDTDLRRIFEFRRSVIGSVFGEAES